MPNLRRIQDLNHRTPLMHTAFGLIWSTFWWTSSIKHHQTKMIVPKCPQDSPRVCASKTSGSATGSCTPRRSASAQRRTSASASAYARGPFEVWGHHQIFYELTVISYIFSVNHDGSDGSGVFMSFGWNKSPRTNTALSLWRFGSGRSSTESRTEDFSGSSSPSHNFHGILWHCSHLPAIPFLGTNSRVPALGGLAKWVAFLWKAYGKSLGNQLPKSEFSSMCIHESEKWKAMKNTIVKLAKSHHYFVEHCNCTAGTSIVHWNGQEAIRALRLSFLAIQNGSQCFNLLRHTFPQDNFG